MNKHLLCIVILALMGFASNTFAQDITARIDGQVTDPARGGRSKCDHHPDEYQNRRSAHRFSPNDTGSYTITQIQPGTYDLSVRAQGFKEYLSKGLELSVNDRKTINIPLETVRSPNQSQ